MIDHASVPVRDLAASAAFYKLVLEPLGYSQLVTRPATVGFGKRYPEFWLNHRPAMRRLADSGHHICLRARSRTAVEAFHALALRHGGACAGPPGLRQGEMTQYYGAFVEDRDGNRIEVLTLPRD